MYAVESDFSDTLIKYGLYIGAIIQIACLIVVIFKPESTPGSKYGYASGDLSDDDSEDNLQVSPRRPHTHHRSRKQDKKKRR
ncbi:hypothetical protein WDU94_004897 [Cyamophila willieti]